VAAPEAVTSRHIAERYVSAARYFSFQRSWFVIEFENTKAKAFRDWANRA
jgi:hypothetical protein